MSHLPPFPLDDPAAGAERRTGRLPVVHAHALDQHTLVVSGVPPLVLLARLREALPAGVEILSSENDVDLGAAARELLSEQELAVVRQITLGAGNRDVAARLGLSRNTVKSYIRTAYRKMDVSTRSQAVRWGLRHGLDRMPARVVVDDVAPPGRRELREPR